MMFKYKHEDNVFSLAYLRFCQSLGWDEDTGMWIVQNTDKYEVLPISDIVYNVHMVPFFDSPTMLRDNEFEDVYSFDMYLVNCFSDRFAFGNFS